MINEIEDLVADIGMTAVLEGVIAHCNSAGQRLVELHGYPPIIKDIWDDLTRDLESAKAKFSAGLEKIEE